MRTFKIIDLGMQIGIAVTSAVVAFFSPLNAVVCFFFWLLAWNLLSLLVNVFLPISKPFSEKRIWLYVQTAVILVFPLLSPWVQWPDFSFLLYIIYAFGLAIYYMVLCYQELSYLTDLRDQIKLSDVQHH